MVTARAKNPCRIAARAAAAHCVHVFWIVHATEHSGARRFGCDKLNTTDRLARERLGDPPRLPRRLKGVSRANVAPGMLTHHFHGYAGLIAALTIRANKRQAGKLAQLGISRSWSQVDIAVAYFKELAKLDLSDEYFRLRRVAGRESWNWSATEEAELAGSFTALLEPLRNQLRFDRDEQSEMLMRILWAIYQRPLRLALIKALLPRGANH